MSTLTTHEDRADVRNAVTRLEASLGAAAPAGRKTDELVTAALRLLAGRQAGQDLSEVSDALGELWPLSAPGRFVLLAGEGAEEVFDAYGVTAPEVSDDSVLRDRFLEFCGFEASREPVSFSHGGTGDVAWLIDLNERRPDASVTVETRLTEFASQF